MKEFSFDTIEEFDKHINDSIYGYDLLHNLIVNISEFFIMQSSELPVVDLGCTSGKLLAKLKSQYSFLRCIGYDKTNHNFLKNADIELIKTDITHDFEMPESQIVYSIFTMQFIEMNKRQNLIEKVCKSINQNGAFIICEKEYANTAKMQEVYTFSNYSNKQKSFNASEILQKEKDIRTIMHPLTSDENKAMLKDAGFKNVDTFFKSLNFTGYICTK